MQKSQKQLPTEENYWNNRMATLRAFSLTLVVLNLFINSMNSMSEDEEARFRGIIKGSLCIICLVLLLPSFCNK